MKKKMNRKASKWKLDKNKTRRQKRQDKNVNPRRKNEMEKRIWKTRDEKRTF